MGHIKDNFTPVLYTGVRKDCTLLFIYFFEKGTIFFGHTVQDARFVKVTITGGLQAAVEGDVLAERPVRCVTADEARWAANLSGWQKRAVLALVADSLCW